jgi:hypothetical protein
MEMERAGVLSGFGPWRGEKEIVPGQAGQMPHKYPVFPYVLNHIIADNGIPLPLHFPNVALQIGPTLSAWILGGDDGIGQPLFSSGQSRPHIQHGLANEQRAH